MEDSALLTVPRVNQSPEDRADLGRASSTPVATNMVTERPASDHASHAAARALVPPAPRFCSLVPSVTTPLYRTIVSQTLRLALRGRDEHQDPGNHDPGERLSENGPNSLRRTSSIAPFRFMLPFVCQYGAIHRLCVRPPFICVKTRLKDSEGSLVRPESLKLS